MDFDPDVLDESTPVLVGVGTACRSPIERGPDGPVEPIDLMVEAARESVDDALSASRGGGATELIRAIDWIAVPVGTWSCSDPAALVAQRLGVEDVHTVRVDVGVSQQTPLRVAWELISAARIDAAMVVGGEAKATQQRRSRLGVEAPTEPVDDEAADECWHADGEIIAQAEIDVGMWQAVEHYACIDNALAYAEGLSLGQQLDRNADVWQRMNQAAALNPEAAFPAPVSLEFLRSPGPGNRPLAHPYAKWHSTQWAVDQAGALLMCSVGAARRMGIPPQRWVFPRVLIESSDAVPLSCREVLHRWPAMGVLGRAAAEHLGVPLSSIEHVDLYSCFPAAVRVQQLELGLDPSRTPTSTGGMTFAGGPFNNYTYQSTSAVVRAVRNQRGSLGLVSTVSGLLTKPAIAVWSTEPGSCPLVADLAEQAAANTARRSVTAEYSGNGVVVTYTLAYDGDVASRAFVIADVPSSAGGVASGRWIGTSADPDLIAAGLLGELIGRSVSIDVDTCSLG